MNKNDDFSFDDMMASLFPSTKEVYKKYKSRSQVSDIMRIKRRGPGTGTWKRKIPAKLYQIRADIERQSIVEYFTNHPEFGSTEWFDSDEEIANRSRRDGQLRASHNTEAWRCPDCKKVWQSALDTMVYSHEVLAPSNWKNIPLNKNKCPVCKGKGEKRENKQRKL